MTGSNTNSENADHQQSSSFSQLRVGEPEAWTKHPESHNITAFLHPDCRQLWKGIIATTAAVLITAAILGSTVIQSVHDIGMKSSRCIGGAQALRLCANYPSVVLHCAVLCCVPHSWSHSRADSEHFADISQQFTEEAIDFQRKVSSQDIFTEIWLPALCVCLKVL